MTAREELAKTIRLGLHEYGATGTIPSSAPRGVPYWGDRLWLEESDCPEGIADALIAEGWRKMPSRKAVEQALANSWDDATEYEGAVDAILALMEGTDDE